MASQGLALTAPTSCLATGLYFRTGYLHDLWTLPPLAGQKVYAIGSFEFGKMYGFPAESGFPNDVAAGVLAETAVGPLILGASWGDSGHRKWFFRLRPGVLGTGGTRCRDVACYV